MPQDPRDGQDEARRGAIAAGQNLERRGLMDAAIQAYLSGGAYEEAARVLVGQRRFNEAGQFLLHATGVPPEAVGHLDPVRRKLALNAAICFARAGDAQRAASLFLALGERARAEEALRKAGDTVGANRVVTGAQAPGRAEMTAAQAVQAAQKLESQGRFDLAMEAYLRGQQPQHAARMAVSLGRFEEAAELFVRIGFFFEAAECYEHAGDGARCLEAIEHLPKDDRRYRAACERAVRVASALGQLDFRLDHFLAPYLETQPRSPLECETFYQAAQLYASKDHMSSAEQALRALLAFDPNYKDAAKRLERLKSFARGSAKEMAKILEEEESFRQATKLPDLPDLPDLPSLPPTAVAGHRSSAPPAPTQALGSDETVPPAARKVEAETRAARSNPPSSAREETPRLSSSPPAPARTGAAIDQLLAIGNVIAGRYRIEKKIGQGGMAAVFRALDLELNERIALKLFTQRLDDEQMVQRFKQELSLSRQLLHPNIIHLFDMGSEEGFRFITMELLSGGDLRAKLGKPLGLATGLNYLRQCCVALQHAHSKGVVHRDVKPANIFLTDDGVIKLMDFGIAKRQSTPGLTVAGMIAGTPEYMSPEQIQGFERVTASTDLYAIGIMAYEFFVGSVPFKSPELMPLLLMQMNDRPPDPRLKNPQVPAALSDLILRLLEKDPARRYASCQEVVTAIDAIAIR